jgi:ABC-type lipoprotein release transport system permease subunit
MSAYLATIELRRRWRAVLILARVLALVTGTVLASLAGATALPRRSAGRLRTAEALRDE